MKICLQSRIHGAKPLRPKKQPSLPHLEGVVAPWCDPLTLQPEQSGGVSSIPGRTPPLECHDKRSQI